MCQALTLRRLPASTIAAPPSRSSPPRAPMPIAFAPVNANPLVLGAALALTPRTWIVVPDVRPDVAPVAVSVWLPAVRVAPKTVVVQKAPLVSVVTEGYEMLWSNVMVTASPGRKPWPQKVRLDPAVGLSLLTEVVVGFE